MTNPTEATPPAQPDTDLKKLDLSNIDFTKIDFSKIDTSKLDTFKFDTAKFDITKLPKYFSKAAGSTQSPQNTSVIKETREESIAAWTERTAEIQSDYPDVDFKSTVIEKTVSHVFDMKEKVDPEILKRHEAHITEMMAHLMAAADDLTLPATPNPDVSTEEPNSKSPSAAEREAALTKAEESFHAARDVLKENGNEEVLQLFDSVYLQPDRPLRTALEQMSETFAYMKFFKGEAAKQGQEGGSAEKASGVGEAAAPEGVAVAGSSGGDGVQAESGDPGKI